MDGKKEKRKAGRPKGSRKTYNPDGVTRYRKPNATIDAIMSSVLALDPELGKVITPKKLKELFITIMCFFAQFFFENPELYFEYGLFRIYKPDGLGKFLTWEVIKEEFNLHPELVTQEYGIENELLKQFREQMAEFLTSLCRNSITADTSIKETMHKLRRRTEWIKIANKEKKEKENGK